MVAQSPRHSSVLASLVESLPILGDVGIEGRPILASIDRDPAGLEPALQATVKVAAANRGQTPESMDPKTKLRVRAGLRHVSQVYISYKQEKSRFMMAMRRKDEAMERSLAPRSPAARSSVTVQLQELVSQESAIMESKNRLISLWTTFQTERLSFERLLGTLPYDTWDGFFEQFNTLRGPVAPDAVPPDAPAPPELTPRIPPARRPAPQ